MYFITTKRMLEVCFSAHPNIQYRTNKTEQRLRVSAPFFSFGLPCHYSLSDETALVTYG